MSEKKDKIGEEAVWMCAENERLKSCLEDQHAATDGLHNALNDLRSQLTEAERKLKEAEEVARDLARPHESISGLIPLVIYFSSDADRSEFVQAFKEVKPSCKTIKL